MTLGTLLVLLVVAGMIVWLIRSAPFIAEPWKSWATYAVIAFVLIYIVGALLGGWGQVTNIRVGG